MTTKYSKVPVFLICLTGTREKRMISLRTYAEIKTGKREIKIKVLLINPPLTHNKKSQKRCVEPMGLASMAAVLEENGHDVRIMDCMAEGYYIEEIVDERRRRFGLPDTEIRRRIKEYEPDVVGVSCLMSMNAVNAHRMCQIAKEVNPKIITVMGGSHVGAMPEETLLRLQMEVVPVAVAVVLTVSVCQIQETNTKRVVMVA